MVAINTGVSGMLTLEEKKKRKAEYKKEWYQKNKERMKEVSAEYYQKNKEAIAEKIKEYYKNNREAREAKRETAKKWREKNKEYKAAKDKVYRIKYYQKNKEAIAKRMKEWGKEYREKQKNNIEAREAKREYDKEWSKNKYRTDLTWKMSRILIKSLRNKLKRHLIKGTNPEFSYTKAASSLLGCTVEELKTHIENQFEDGMTWENWTRDGWHLDHIVPCSSFDLTKKKEQKKCFHYTNLQPLWAEDNLSKGSKLNWNKKELVV